MYKKDHGLFVFRLRRRGSDQVLEGMSRRYTAIALIGIAEEEEGVARQVLGGEAAQDVCRRLLGEVGGMDNLGDVALTLWAARALGDERALQAFDRLRELAPWQGTYPTVEVAWALTALSIDAGDDSFDGECASKIARRLLSAYVPQSCMFAHWPAGSARSWLRSHVTCFADLVYPVQALAHHYTRTGDADALAAARNCARRTCELQGAEGQWWWHYDVRTGRVLERYPVYAVHQDAMAPMALLDLKDACGADHSAAVQRGVNWLLDPSETETSLLDNPTGVIWRKVGRYEPDKLARGLQAAASRIHPTLRVPLLNAVLPPGRVDYESRPYHFGWLLYAFASRRQAI